MLRDVKIFEEPGKVLVGGATWNELARLIRNISREDGDSVVINPAGGIELPSSGTGSGAAVVTTDSYAYKCSYDATSGTVTCTGGNLTCGSHRWVQAAASWTAAAGVVYASLAYDSSSATWTPTLAWAAALPAPSATLWVCRIAATTSTGVQQIWCQGDLEVLGRITD